MHKLTPVLFVAILLSACATGLDDPYIAEVEADADDRVKGSGNSTSPDVVETTEPDQGNADTGGPGEDMSSPDIPPSPDTGPDCEELQWWPDSDNDSYGNGALAPVSSCEPLQGYVNNGDDCDDTRALSFPGGLEEPGDGVDGDCDGFEICFVDGDGDGSLTDEPATQMTLDLGCSGPNLAGADAPRGDCDDANPALHPLVPEVCDGVDQNCDGFPDDGDVCPCPVEHRDDTGGVWDTYMMCNTPMRWGEALEMCRTYGYDLATVDHQGENAWMSNEGQSMSMPRFWIGFNDIESGGDFVWSSGLASTFTFWIPGQPNNQNDEDCTEIVTDHSEPGWNDLDCDNTRPFVCEAFR